MTNVPDSDTEVSFHRLASQRARARRPALHCNLSARRVRMLLRVDACVDSCLAQLFQERVDRLSSLFWLLAHPPMTRALQNGDLRPSALGRTARELLAAA